jgi:hypothetical protein
MNDQPLILILTMILILESLFSIVFFSNQKIICRTWLDGSKISARKHEGLRECRMDRILAEEITDTISTLGGGDGISYVFVVPDTQYGWAWWTSG